MASASVIVASYHLSLGGAASSFSRLSLKRYWHLLAVVSTPPLLEFIIASSVGGDHPRISGGRSFG